MSWVYGNYKYVYSHSAWMDFKRQNLKSNVDHRAVKVNPSAAELFCFILIFLILQKKKNMVIYENKHHTVGII